MNAQEYLGMTTVEASEILGVTKGYVARLCQKGKLRAHKVGRDWIVDPESVEAYKNAPKNKGGRPRKAPEPLEQKS